MPETLSTLAYKMVHLWQYYFGDSGRRVYHNREKADRMDVIVLMPSNTGKPGRWCVGAKMTHYISEVGLFDCACRDLMTREFALS